MTRLRHVPHRDVWERLTLLEKIAVVQVIFAGVSLLLLVVLVTMAVT